MGDSVSQSPFAVKIDPAKTVDTALNRVDLLNVERLVQILL
jgi:hypothetical protein